MTSRLVSALLAIMLLALFAATPSAALASQAADTGGRDGIYVWTDEDGVVHMRDKKPEGQDGDMTRLERRRRYQEQHPETKEQAEALTSEQDAQGSRAPAEPGKLPPDYVPHSPEDFSAPADPEDQLARELREFQEFGNAPDFQLSPMQMISVMAVPLLFGLLMYLAMGYVLYRVGRKFGVGSFIGYVIPFYNIVLLCRCAGLSGWFVLFLFLPIINIFVTFLIWGKIAERLGKNMVLWGLLITLLGLPVLILAFDSSRPVGTAHPRGQAPSGDQPNVYI